MVNTPRVFATQKQACFENTQPATGRLFSLSHVWHYNDIMALNNFDHNNFIRIEVADICVHFRFICNIHSFLHLHGEGMTF